MKKHPNYFTIVLVVGGIVALVFNHLLIGIVLIVIGVCIGAALSKRNAKNGPAKKL